MVSPHILLSHNVLKISSFNELVTQADNIEKNLPNLGITSKFGSNFSRPNLEIATKFGSNSKFGKRNETKKRNLE